MVGHESAFFSYECKHVAALDGTSTTPVLLRAEACNALGLLLEQGSGCAGGEPLKHVAATLFLCAATTGYPSAWLNVLSVVTELGADGDADQTR